MNPGSFFLPVPRLYTWVRLVLESDIVTSVIKFMKFGLWLASPGDGLNGNNGINVFFEAIAQVEVVLLSSLTFLSIAIKSTWK